MPLDYSSAFAALWSRSLGMVGDRRERAVDAWTAQAVDHAVFSVDAASACAGWLRSWHGSSSAAGKPGLYGERLARTYPCVWRVDRRSEYQPLRDGNSALWFPLRNRRDFPVPTQSAAGGDEIA